MAYLLLRDNSGYFTSDNTVATTVPLTLSMWKRSSSTAAQSTAMMIELSNGTNNQRYTLVQEIFGGNQDILAYSNGTGGGANSSLVAPVSTNWQHICAVFSSSSYRISYLNGVAGTANTTNVITSGINKIFIGSRSDQAFTFGGNIAEVAVYNAALTQEEITMLSKGISPELVRPANLKIYCPLIRNINATFGGFNLSAPSTVYPSEHPRML